MCQGTDRVPFADIRWDARSRTTTVETIKEEPAAIQPDLADEKVQTKGRKTTAKSSGSARERVPEPRKAVVLLPLLRLRLQRMGSIRKMLTLSKMKSRHRRWS